MNWRLRIAGCAFSIICLLQMMMPCHCANHIATETQSGGCSCCGACDHVCPSSDDACKAGKESRKHEAPAPCEKCAKRAFVAAYKIDTGPENVDGVISVTLHTEFRLSVGHYEPLAVRSAWLDIVIEARCTQRMQV